MSPVLEIQLLCLQKRKALTNRAAYQCLSFHYKDSTISLLAMFYGLTICTQFVSYMVGKSEDRFSYCKASILAIYGKQNHSGSCYEQGLEIMELLSKLE